MLEIRTPHGSVKAKGRPAMILASAIGVGVVIVALKYEPTQQPKTEISKPPLDALRDADRADLESLRQLLKLLEVERPERATPPAPQKRLFKHAQETSVTVADDSADSADESRGPDKNASSTPRCTVQWEQSARESWSPQCVGEYRRLGRPAVERQFSGDKLPADKWIRGGYMR